MNALQQLVLITRPEAEAQPLAATLRVRGYDTLIAPLLSISPIAHEPVPPCGGIIITSRHALAAVPLSHHQTPAFIVGKETAQMAAAQGLSRITQAETADALLHIIIAQAPPLIYLRGKYIAFDMAGALAEHGLPLQEIIVYEAAPAAALPRAAQEALREQRVTAAPFFSARTARHFAWLIAAAELAEYMRGIDAFALSAACAEPIAQLPWRHMTISPAPNASALLRAMDKRLRGE